jgi:hypothetical protein
MADLSVQPIGSTVKPVPGMSLGEMVNLARGAQAYQQAEKINPLLLQSQQQSTTTGQIALTLEQQKERERMAMQQFLAKPENFQTNGRIDIDKLNAVVPSLAPLTGLEYVQKFTTLGQAQTQAIQAKQGLTQEQRNMIAQRFAILGRLGVQDKGAYIAEMDLLKKENPGNRDLADLIDAYKVTWNDIPSGPQLPSMAIAGANTLLTPAQQQEAFAPRASTASTGAATFPVVVQPSVAGEAPRQTVGEVPITTTQLGPDQYEVIDPRPDPLTNLPVAITRNREGAIIGRRLLSGAPTPQQMPGQTLPTPIGREMRTLYPTSTLPQVTPVTPIPPGETPETVGLANQVRIRALESATQVPLQNFNNNEIIRLSDEALTGRGAGMLANLTGGYAVFNAVGLGGGNATALNQLGHYMALQTATLAQSAGLGTDAARNIAAETTGTVNWTPEAIKKTARVNRSLATATDLFNQGIQSQFSKTQNPLSARDFQNKWSQTADINAIRLFDAMRNNDQDGFREVVDSIGGLRSPGFDRLKNKVEAIKRLVGMQ